MAHRSQVPGPGSAPCLQGSVGLVTPAGQTRSLQHWDVQTPICRATQPGVVWQLADTYKDAVRHREKVVTSHLKLARVFEILPTAAEGGGSWGPGQVRPVSRCHVKGKAPRLGPHVAPQPPSLLTPCKERSGRLDWKRRSQPAPGKPESAGSCFLIAEGLCHCQTGVSSRYLKGQSALGSWPHLPGWFLVGRIFCSHTVSQGTGFSQAADTLLVLSNPQARTNDNHSSKDKKGSSLTILCQSYRTGASQHQLFYTFLLQS